MMVMVDTWKQRADILQAEKDELVASAVALAARIAELEAKTAVSMGVGSGSGRLFVHGDYESIKAAQEKIFRLEAAEARIAELEAERANTEKYLAEIVQERIDEIGAEAEAFDRDAINTLRTLLQQSDGFDWTDGWSPQDAYDFLTTERQEAWNAYERERKRAEAAEARNAALVKALRDIEELGAHPTPWYVTCGLLVDIARTALGDSP